jgi:hypothetical protein
MKALARIGLGFWILVFIGIPLVYIAVRVFEFFAGLAGIPVVALVAFLLIGACVGMLSWLVGDLLLTRDRR